LGGTTFGTKERFTVRGGWTVAKHAVERRLKNSKHPPRPKKQRKLIKPKLYFAHGGHKTKQERRRKQRRNRSMDLMGCKWCRQEEPSWWGGMVDRTGLRKRSTTRVSRDTRT